MEFDPNQQKYVFDIVEAIRRMYECFRDPSNWQRLAVNREKTASVEGRLEFDTNDSWCRIQVRICKGKEAKKAHAKQALFQKHLFQRLRNIIDSPHRSG